MNFRPAKIKKSGLPQYCVRKRGGSRSMNYYYQKNDFRVPLPEPSSPDFWGAYWDAKARCDESAYLSESVALKHMGMMKGELDRYFAQIERGAKRRAGALGREYSLPKYWGADTYVAQGGLCALTGIVMRKSEYRFDPYGPSIDRIDSSAGYTPENCQLTILHINLAKKDLGEEEFIRLCRAVVSTRRKHIVNGA